MPSVSIFHTNNPEGPANEGMLRWEIQQKRNDPESKILNEFKVNFEKMGSNELIEEYCEKLGGITIEQFLHKLQIFVGNIEDDEREWREQKYGKQ
ncbi:hypothetical protein [Methanosphaera sp.]